MQDIDHPFYPKSTREEADGIAWVFTNKDSELVQYPFKFSQLNPNQVRLKILHTSLCYSDVMHSRQMWGQQFYPCCPGHEVVGQVTQVGAQAQTLKVGDFVGVSPIRYADLTCRYCTSKKQDTNMCNNRVYLYGQQFGGYCTHMQIDHNWAIKIPEGLHDKLHEIPPLLCAGITVYAPIKRYARPGAKCAIVGIGGLGHLGVQYANKLGMKVTAFTTKVNNIEPLKALGASDAQHSINEEQLAKNEGKYDLVLSTLHIDNPLHHRLHQRLTKKGGVFVMLGAPNIKSQYVIDTAYMIQNQITVCGSNVGSIREVAEMLQFSSHYNIQSINEYFAFQDFNKAFHRLQKENPRFRAVVNVTDWAKKNGFDK